MRRGSADDREAGGFRFKSLDQLCSELGATQQIRRLLVANNGLAAVKGIDSIRSWLYDHIGDEEAIQIAVMATPEDLKANAEFIRIANQHIPVPGGPNTNNYANVDLILHTCAQHMCDAIYPGWGHASENPALPRECLKSSRGLVFLGPTEESMFALGDKIASTIVAQSNGVPTVPWSGDAIRLPPGVYDVDAEIYDKAYVTTPEECEEVCRRIGFPVMLKASEGGGGKGIRCCASMEEVKTNYFAVSEEVKGCHIFVMRMLDNVRHLEVQLLADCYDNCIAVRTRDCSVQRRHQKIIEEGPAFGVDVNIIKRMESCAIQLAKAVNYRGLGTVEFMYDKTTHDFFFLELNPRIQVEHPVSEMISGVNLPAALLCVGMGIRLDRIPDVRAFYGEDPYGTTPIEFEVRTSLKPKCHTIAVRVTAEDTDEGFRPTSGKVEEISFKNSKECWGYFSVSSGGEIHQYADSQFGHIFSSGVTREEARRGMVLALRNLIIRGEIRTSSSYVLELLETPEFRECDVSTAWLDGLIAKRAAEAPKQQRSVHVALIAASIFRCLQTWNDDEERYSGFLSAGHVPSTEYLHNNRVESYISGLEKYTIQCGKVSPTEYAVTLNGSTVVVPYRLLKSGALQLTIAAKTVVAYVEKDPSSLRITVGGKVTNLTGDLDPTKLLASVPGRLVRYIIADEGHVNEGGTYAEVEVMKMILPLRASTNGILHHRAVAGSTIAMGSLLAEITPDDPSKVLRPMENVQPWPCEVLGEGDFVRPDGATRASRAAETLWNLLQGYHVKEIPLDVRLAGVFEDLTSLFLSSVRLQAVRVSYLSEESIHHPDHQSPTGKQKAIFDAIINTYVEMERPFDDCSRQEAMERLRASCETSAEVFQRDFAHHQECHHDVIKGILSYLESNNVLLKSMQTTLATLVQLHSYSYGSLLLQTRYLLRQCSLPSLTERKALLVRDLEAGSLSELMQGGYSYDLLCSIMFDRQASHLTQVCLELFIRREYLGECSLVDLDVFKSGGNWYGTYRVEAMREEGDDGAEDLNISGGATDPMRAADDFVGDGMSMVFMEVPQLYSGLAHSFDSVLSHRARTSTSATIFFCISRQSTQNTTSELCRDALRQSMEAIDLHENLRTIFFVVHGMQDGPHMFTFRRPEPHFGFEEDKLLRNVLPQSARRLELDRLANFNVSMYPTPYKDVHLFRATPRRARAAAVESRFFARVAVTPREMGLAPWTEATDVDGGHMLAKCLAALEVAHDDPTLAFPPSNHVYVKLIELTFDVSSLHKLLAAVASPYKQKMIALGVSEVELSFQVRTASGLIPMRVIVSSPSGYGITVHLYYETIEGGLVYLHRAETSEDVVLTQVPSSSDILVDVNPSSPLIAPAKSMRRTIAKLVALRELLPHGEPPSSSAFEDYRFGTSESSSAIVGSKKVLGAYPELSATNVKRLQARATGTTYCHDWPALIGLLVRKEWRGMCRMRGLNHAEVAPVEPFACTQLFLGEDGENLTTASSSAPCGMVAWILEYAPPKYFRLEGGAAPTRRVVLVANDITHQSGSFSVIEDRVFRAASVLARSQGLPFVYLSANSGARLGLCAELKKRFLVQFTPTKMIDYLYLRERDYEELTAKKVEMAVEMVEVDGERRYILQGIVGAPDEYLGVENLRGSGLVAGEMSKNYSEIPTISVVSGRSVGIGAYLNRLGRRVIQTNDSPLILTGAGALNRLLGKDVYLDNSQLGGRQIMVPNGITHWSTRTDYGSAKTLLQWLDYVPPIVHARRCRPQRLLWPKEDPIDRDVGYTPQPNTPYDPRWLINGCSDQQLGLFDHGSWSETLEGWAKSVVAGRATLGGIPCGIIVVETRLSKKFDPADPADPTSTSSFVAQAGQVWFPDSARKTADAIDDFHRERLPCFIFANWRGFSGGMRDMFDEILKFGASIVDNLRTYTAPVFIHIPPHGELRGGAWVVVDPVINHNGVVEMYCDSTARGGVLEPAGVVEIKFREGDVRDLMRRCGEEEAKGTPTTASTSREAVDAQRLSQYRDVAVRFADLHDTPVRMKAVGVVREVVEWRNSRRSFYRKLMRKLTELEIANDLLEAHQAADLSSAVELIQTTYRQEHPNGPAWGTDDDAQREWMLAHGSFADDKDDELAEEARINEIRKLLMQSKRHNSGKLDDVFADLFQDPQMALAASSALKPTRTDSLSHSMLA